METWKWSEEWSGDRRKRPRNGPEEPCWLQTSTSGRYCCQSIHLVPPKETRDVIFETQFAFGSKSNSHLGPSTSRIWEVLFVLWFGRLDDHPPRPQPRYRPMDLEEFVIYCSDLQRPIRCNLGAYLVVFESTKPTDPSSMAQMIWGMNS